MTQRMRLATIIGGLSAAAVVAACTHPSAPSTKTPLSLVRLRAEPTAFMMFGGYDDPQNLVVRDRDTWLKTWNEIHRRLAPIPPLPEIDFTSEMVAVAALGQRPSSGYDLVFTSAAEADGVVTLEVETRTHDPRCLVLTVITTPVDVARIPKRAGSVVFHTTPTIILCS